MLPLYVQNLKGPDFPFIFFFRSATDAQTDTQLSSMNPHPVSIE